MRHYVLTRSAFGPAWERSANQRRLRITRAVTARLMARQTATDWSWIVLLDERDPFLRERLKVFGDAAPAFCPLVWRPPDEPRARDHLRVQRIAAADYRAPWRDLVGPADDTVLMTRIDDDDGFAPSALDRYRRAAEGLEERTALMLPMGVRVYRNRYVDVRHDRNAMHSLVTPPGDTATVYDYGHTKVGRQGMPVLTVDLELAWIWVRHRDTISGHHNAQLPITPRVRRAFPVDWRALATAWAA